MASVSRQQPILSLTGETPELHPANTIRKALTLEVFFLEWQQLLMAQKRPRGKRQKSPAQPERPRRERPPHDQSGTASEGFEAFCRRFIEPRLREHVERQAEGDIKQSVRPTSSRESSTSGEASKQLIKLVLGLAQLIVHRYIAKRTATENTAEETQDSFSGISTQWSEAPLSGRDGSPLSARDDQLVASLDRVLDQLQATEDLLVRTMYSPASHENCQIRRSILVHANSLQAAIGRAAAQVRGLRGRLKSGDQGGNQCDRASEGARRQYGESASYYWPSGG